MGTIGASFLSKSLALSGDRQPVKLKIWDTAGQEKYRSLAPMYYRGSAAAILVFDLVKPESFVELESWAIELKNKGPENIVVVVCGNKLDLDEDRMIDHSQGEGYARSIGAQYYECSAKSGANVKKMFLELAERVTPISDDCLLTDDGGLDL